MSHDDYVSIAKAKDSEVWAVCFCMHTSCMIKKGQDGPAGQYIQGNRLDHDARLLGRIGDLIDP